MKVGRSDRNVHKMIIRVTTTSRRGRMYMGDNGIGNMSECQADMDSQFRWVAMM